MILRKCICGVCAKEVRAVIEDGIIHSIEFIGGCDGQCKTMNALLVGTKVTDAVEKLTGIKCGRRDTSCANELATMLRDTIE